MALCLAPSVATAQSGATTHHARTPDNPYALTSEENPYENAAANAESPYATDAAAEEEAAAPGAGADADGTSPTPEDDESVRIRIHRFGFGFTATPFSTEDTTGFSLLGTGLMHEWFIGKRWGFMSRLAVGFPVSGRMVNRTQGVDFRVGLRDPYEDQRLESDGMAMVARRWALTDELELMAGVGVHVHTFRLLGQEYMAIDGITAGLGSVAHLDYRMHDMFSIGAEYAVALDPIDFVAHTNRIVIAVPMSLSFTVSVRR